tara:strand:+ start:298 stop:525 length:228 start_codon:yes stop_codon:yes gene_type:complete
MDTVEIENKSHLVRDMSSKAVINTNDILYNQRLEQIDNIKNTQKKKEEFEKEFNALKSDVNEIKDLLKSLLASNQ